jgi:hypothetical protein
MENITLTENKDPIPSQQIEVRLAEVEVKDENIALNVMVGFLVYAQKKGVFSFDESAKIWECIKMFQRPPPNST